MTNQKYILGKNHELIEVDLMTWAEFFEDNNNRRVAKDTIGDATISTVFLGIDHNFGEGEPLLFETMIFGGQHDQYQERYPGAFVRAFYDSPPFGGNRGKFPGRLL